MDVIIADPPYNIGKDFGNDSDKQELSEYLLWCDEWIKECYRVLKPTGTMYIYGFSEILAHILVRHNYPSRWLVWHYTNKNSATHKFWQRSHESIILFWKEDRIFNQDLVREPYTDSFLNNAAGKKRAGTPSRFSSNGQETIYKAHEKGALPRDVIKVPALAGGAGLAQRWFFCKDCKESYPPKAKDKHLSHDTFNHPTQKPFELTRKLIQASAPIDDKSAKILIPFAGSGSECVVAKDLKYEFIAFELNPEYVLLANSFIKKCNIISN